MSPDRSCPQKTTLPISSSPGGVTRLIGWAALSLLVALTFAPAAQATTRLEFASS